MHVQPKTKVLIMLLFSALFLLSFSVNAEPDEALKKLLTVMNVGTAWSVAPGFIITNKHVVGNHKKVIFLRTDQTTFQGEWVLDDKVNDLALFYADPKIVGNVVLPLAERQPGLGAQVFTIGFPHPKVLGVSPKLTSGLINAERGFEDNPNTYQISVPLQSGNSGGPLFNMRGEVVGITTWKLSAAKMFKLTGDLPQNVNYAVKIKSVKNLLTKIPIKWRRIKKGAHPESMEMLAKRIKKQVFIVLAGGKNFSSMNYKNMESVKGSMFYEPKREQQRIGIISYAEPAEFEIEERILNSWSLNLLSRSTTDMIAGELAALSDGQARVTFKLYGRFAKRLLNITRKFQQSSGLCRREKLDLILVLEMEPDDTLDEHDVTLRIHDCQSHAYYRNAFTVSGNRNDQNFAYETKLRDVLHKFMSGLPENINWIGR